MTQLKINKPKKRPVLTRDLSINLRQVIRKQRKPINVWRFFCYVLILIGLLFGLKAFIFVPERVDFANLRPEEITSFSVINLKQSYPQFQPFYYFLSNMTGLQRDPLAKFNSYLTSASLDFEQDVQPLVKDELAIMIFEGNSDSILPYAIVLQSRQDVAKIRDILGQIAPEMKVDFNFFTKVYRQNQLIVLESLYSKWNTIIYAIVGDYIIITNSEEVASNIIDKIIN